MGEKDLGRKISIVRCLTAYGVQGDTEQVSSLVAETTEEALRMIVLGREEGLGWGTHVYLWRIHFDIWQNQYNIVKLKNKIKFKKKE